MTVQCNFVCNNLAQSRVAVSSSSYRSIDGNSAIEAGNREKSDRRPCGGIVIMMIPKKGLLPFVVGGWK